MRENEKHAAECLLRFLAERFKSKVSWEPGENPPDFVFTVQGEEWAVEETQLHQYIQHGNKATSTQAIVGVRFRMTMRHVRRVVSASRGQPLNCGGCAGSSGKKTCDSHCMITRPGKTSSASIEWATTKVRA